MSSSETTNRNKVELNKLDLDSLIDRIYSKIIDLAKEKQVFFDKQTRNHYDTEPIQRDQQSTVSCIPVQENPDELSNITDYYLSSNDTKFNILRHTCLCCYKSFEKSKFLLRHFLIEHLIEQQVYKCYMCLNEPELEHYFDLDNYVQHHFSKHMKFIINDPKYVYDLFILKTCQDSILHYYTTGTCYLNPKNLKHLNKLKYGKEVTSLNERLNLKIFENFFESNELKCKSPISLTSRSIKSNLIYTLVNKVDILADLFSYFNQKFDPDQSDSSKYYQCKFCLKLLPDFNDYKIHLLKIHSFNDQLAKCVVCPYCHQLCKSTSSDIINVLNNHILEECKEVRMGTMPALNSFKCQSKRKLSVEISDEEGGTSDQGLFDLNSDDLSDDDSKMKRVRSDPSVDDMEDASTMSLPPSPLSASKLKQVEECNEIDGSLIKSGTD